MSEYSQKLKDEVIDYVNAEKEYDVIPVEMMLVKKDFPNEYKKYPTDWQEEDHFLVKFEDIIKIIDEQEKPE